jgi:hypothetical protein
MRQNSMVETITTLFHHHGLTLDDLRELSRRLNSVIDQKEKQRPLTPFQAIFPVRPIVQLTHLSGMPLPPASPLLTSVAPSSGLVSPSTIQRDIACVRIQKLIAVKVNKGFRSYLSSPKEYELRISVCFDHHKVPCKGGYIRVALKRGDLEFDFQNVDFSSNTNSNRVPSAKEKTERTSLEAVIGLPPSAKLTQGKEIKTELMSSSAWNISDANNPVRRYEVVSIDCLVEREDDLTIGSLQLQGQLNPSGRATFVVREQKDLYLFDPEGIWPKFSHKNKIALIKAMLHKDIFKRLSRPSLNVSFE